jgi:hypothetical protein
LLNRIWRLAEADRVLGGEGSGKIQAAVMDALEALR